MTNILTSPSTGAITRITLLGLLLFKPMHGYEMRRNLEGQRREHWADIQYGSVYASLKQLAKEGLIEETGTEREGNRPPRTVYRITGAGEEELLRMLREAWSKPAFSARPLDTALSFIWLLPQEEVARLLEERLRALDEAARGLDETQEWTERMSREEPGLDHGRGFQAMLSDLFEHSRRLLAGEREWTEYVLGRVRGGIYELTKETLEKWRDQDAWREHTDDQHASD